MATYAHFADRDALTGVVLERMLAGVSTRRYARTQEPVGEDVEQASRSTSKSAVSRAFVARTSERLGELMARRLDDIRLAVLMLDGIDLKGRCNVVALGITTEGVKIPLGLWEGSTENAAVATALLAISSIAAWMSVRACSASWTARRRCARRSVTCSATDTPVQRCIRHKERNVLDHLPERDRPAVKRRLRAAWKLDDHAAALGRLQALADELARSHPGAAASLREGMAETLTVTARIRGALKRTLESHEPVRVDDRVRPTHARATSSAGSPVTWRCAGPPRGCSKPSSSSAR